MLLEKYSNLLFFFIEMSKVKWYESFILIRDENTNESYDYKYYKKDEVLSYELYIN